MHHYLQYPHSANAAYLDSAASDNFGNKHAPLEHIQPLTNADPVHLTNGQTMVPTQTGIMKHLLAISTRNKQYQICPEQSGPALLSVGKLCDDGCVAVMDSEKCIVWKDKPIIKARRCPTTGMCVANLHNPLQVKHLAHANIQQFTSIERLKFLHGALGFPPLSTLRRAISAGYLQSFPDLTTTNMSKLSTSDITVLGRMDSKRKNLQSTKPTPIDDE